MKSEPPRSKSFSVALPAGGLSLQRIVLLAWQALLINFFLLRHGWIQDSRHAGQVLYHWIMSSAPHWVMLSRGSITESCLFPSLGDYQQVPCHWAVFPSLQWSIQILNPSAEWSTHYINVAMDCWSPKRPPIDSQRSVLYLSLRCLSIQSRWQPRSNFTCCYPYSNLKLSQPALIYYLEGDSLLVAGGGVLYFLILHVQVNSRGTLTLTKADQPSSLAFKVPSWDSQELQPFPTSFRNTGYLSSPLYQHYGGYDG